MQEFFYRRGESVCGPISGRHLRALAAAGEVAPGDFVRKGHGGTWIAAERARGLFPTSKRPGAEEHSDEEAFNAFAAERAKAWGASAASAARSLGLSAVYSIRRASITARRHIRRRRAKAVREAPRVQPSASVPVEPAIIVRPASPPPSRIETAPADALMQLRQTMAAAVRDANAPPPEKTLLMEHPAMFGNSPIAFLIGVAFIPFLIGAILLAIWYLECLATTLTVTNRRTLYRRGLLSKLTAEVRHADVGDILIGQTFLQRIFGVGRIAVSSDSRHGTIDASGIRDPEGIKALINRFR
ncbi:MAG TPA: PH domain-containing protein [Planctomycetaceae bacterium]|jgi:hypothetical protein